MSKQIKIKGRLRTLLQVSLYLGFLLVAINVWTFLIDARAGAVLLGFLVFYFAIICYLLFYNKPYLKFRKMELVFAESSDILSMY